MAQLWIFETPISVNATFLVNITWSPRTFNSANYGNFSLNLWLLRKDSTSDTVINNHAPYLLASNHSAFINFVLWRPTLDDVDFKVPEAGLHQIAWEETKNNPGSSPSNTSLEGFSQAFNVKAPASSSVLTSTSTSSTSTSSFSTSLSTSSSTASSAASQIKAPSSSTTNLPTILGLSIGFGLLFLICVTAAIWGVRKYRRIQKSSLSIPPTDSVVPPKYPVMPLPPYRSMTGEELDGGYVRREAKPVELPGMAVVEI